MSNISHCEGSIIFINVGSTTVGGLLVQERTIEEVMELEEVVELIEDDLTSTFPVEEKEEEEACMKSVIAVVDSNVLLQVFFDSAGTVAPRVIGTVLPCLFTFTCEASSYMVWLLDIV